MNTKGERAKPMKTGHESRINAGLDLVVSLPDILLCKDKSAASGENSLNSRPESVANVKTTSIPMTTPISCAESRTRVHDYRQQGWGHALHMIEIEHLDIKPSWWRTLLGEQPKAVSRLSCLAHGYNVHEGDEILVPMQSGKTARFVLADIEHCGEPKDMFKVKAADFIGYLGEQPA